MPLNLTFSAPSFVARAKNNPSLGLYGLSQSLIEHCSEVKAAIAYASPDNMTLLSACKLAKKPLTFYCRYDQSVPVHPDVIRWFLDEANPDFICRVIPDVLHAKIIWWVGAGVYIGSANMTERAWSHNLEAGTFHNEQQIHQLGIGKDLETFFQQAHEHSHAITAKFHRHLIELNNARKTIDKEEAALRAKIRRFFIAPNEVVPGAGVENEAFLRFSREWNESHQFLDDIGTRLERDENRPHWVSAETPKGAHTDQFIHAYYYRYVKGDQGESFVRSANAMNRLSRNQALNEAIRWWRDDYTEYAQEKEQLEHWEPLISQTLARGAVLSLTEKQFVDAMSHVHALRQVARYRPNNELQLPKDQQDLDIKVAAHCAVLWRAKNKRGQSVLDLLNYVLWEETGSVEWRIWRVANDPELKIPKLGTSTLGELAGWVHSHRLTPRNNRTIKGLYCLGYPVPLYRDEDAVEV